MTENVLRLSLWIRFWHGLTALLFIVLTVTGIVLHFSGPRFTLINYAVATTAHDVGGIALAVLYSLYLVFLFGTGYWRHYIPVAHGLGRRVKAQVISYTAGAAGRDEPAIAAVGETRFNALQQLTYLVVVFGLLPLLAITGLLYLYYPAYVPDTVWGLAGLWPVALAHYAIGILGAAYLIIHVYMAIASPKAGTSFKLMTIGRAESARKR